MLPVPVLSLGTTAPRGDFQPNLGHDIHNKYWTESEIKMHCVANKVLAILTDQGRIVRTMNVEYTGAWRNVEKVLAGVTSVISEEDCQHIKQILTQGCPFELRFEEQESSKLQMLRRGN